MKKEPASPSLALEKAEKGSHRSMWELLLQLRVLLPYLARLVPLLEPVLDRAGAKSPDFSEITSGITAVQTVNRDLEVQARNQALQLERIEQQMGRLRVVHENSIEDSRRLIAEIRTLRQSLLVIAGIMLLLLLAIAGMLGFLLARTS
ncbi:MAG TPA: hypothetical protein VMB49_01990 [Acidobacteriaceae bacterium]|nr:hypothetical protein [Acidobacteriaceae bacterium]